MTDFLDPGRAMKPLVNRTVIETLLSCSYGLRMLSCKKLDGYDDLNFWIQVESLGTNENLREICSHGYVLKIMNSLDSQNIHLLDAQHEMMARVHQSGIPAPRAVPTLCGDQYLLKDLAIENSTPSEQTGVNNIFVVRLFDCIPGSTLSSVPLTQGLCYKVGVMAGKVDRTLKGFMHSGFQGNHRGWHLDCSPNLTEVLHVIKDDSDRHLISDILKTFQLDVLTHVEDLQQGVIHGDLNEENILVTKRIHQDRWNDQHDVAAILDYGDSVLAPYIFEVAIAMTYMSISSDRVSVQTASGYVLAGYLSMINLSDEEIRLLKLCMCARMAQSLVIGAHSYHVDPSNEYTQKTAAKGWPRLRQLWKSETDEVVKEWRNINEKCSQNGGN